MDLSRGALTPTEAGCITIARIQTHSWSPVCSVDKDIHYCAELTASGFEKQCVYWSIQACFEPTACNGRKALNSLV